MRSVLTGANAKIQCTGEKNRRNKTVKLILKTAPLRKFGVFPS